MIRHAEIAALENAALQIRERVIRMSAGGGCFLGASLSCVDILTYLYLHHLQVQKIKTKDIGRDYFFLSKGHDVPALYSTFTQIGLLEPERLNNHLKTNDSIYWHPNTTIPGVEFHSGSLGHLLSVALGVAYDCKLTGTGNRIYVLLGDGELNEGSVWEAALTAAALKADNLTVIIDRNMFQANMCTEELIPLESIERKFEAFGWSAITCNGHEFISLDEAFTQLPFEAGRPSVIIADTVRGKGLPSIESRADRWFCRFTDEEIETLLNELHGRAEALLTAETMVVR